MDKIWEGLVELKPGINDEMFDDKDAQGGYIKVYSECPNKKEFNEKVKLAIHSYGSFVVGIEDIRESEESIDDLPEWMGVYFGELHTF
jgi:hypothetical protein